VNKDFAFILGNGITRLDVDPNELLKHGFVYGCNRIYQEFSLNILVSTDKGMSQEIQNTEYPKQYTHYTRQQYLVEHSGSIVLPQLVHNWSSGPAAVGLACLSESNYIYLIGFDLKGQHNLVNNIYAGTEHYKGTDSPPTPWRNWVDQIEILLQKFPGKNIVHVNPLHEFTSERWRKKDNFRTMYLDEFKLVINNT